MAFFFHLRARGLAVSPMEFLTLIEAVEAGLARESLATFYGLARSLLIKAPEYYDIYDQAFAEFFEDSEFEWGGSNAQISDELLSWLDDPKMPRQLTEDELQQLQALNLDALRSQFEERLLEQTERHDGGSRWIGTGGTSPYGHSGTHPGGIRVGGEGQNRSAVQIATKRRFKNLRNDLTLDTRQIGMALRKLRVLTREGHQEELDIDESIAQTAQNAGEVELVFRPPRKNQVKLLLLMDAGGSMSPYAEITSKLFSAAHRANHFKAFESYYFHNCPYEFLYTNIYRGQRIDTQQVLAKLDPSWRCIFVGDAAMAPSELVHAGGAIDYFHYNAKPGIEWLQSFREIVPRCVWLNPNPQHWWGGYTTQVIGQMFPMFPLTIHGLEEAIKQLRG